MAEALSLAANIIAVVTLAAQVTERLADFHSKAKGFNKAFGSISVELPVLINSLKRIEKAIKNGSVSEDRKKVLRPMIKDFNKQIQLLDDLIVKALPKDGDGSVKRSFKAVASFRYDGEIKGLEVTIRNYMQTLTLENVVSSSDNALTVPNAPPSPRLICPFGRDDDFVDRPILTQVISRSKAGSRLALVGKGGVGKSQIAIEYAHRVRDTSPDTWVFWVHAETADKFAADYRKIAKAVAIPDWDDKDTDIFSAVYDWLNNETNGKWVMIIDNADYLDVLTSPAPKPSASGSASNNDPSPPVRDFIPKSQNGFVLITSRDTDTAHGLTGNCNYHVDVEEMSEEESITLLKSKLKHKDAYEHNEMVELVKELDYMPLAISQAAGLLSLRYPRLNISKYLEDLRKPDQQRGQLLEESVYEPSRNSDRSNSIVATWQLSFQYVRRINPSAARLLSLMCLFDRQGIPEALLTGQYGKEAIAGMKSTTTTAAAEVTTKQPKNPWWKRRRRFRFTRKRRHAKKAEQDEEKEKCNFDDDWATLTSLCLIKTNADGKHFNMHRLVQHTTKRWLEINDELKAWMKKYVSLMKGCFPKPDYDNWYYCEYLFPHAQQTIDYRPDDQEMLRIWALLVHQIAEYAEVKGNHKAAEKFRLDAMKAFNLVGDEGSTAMENLYQMGYKEYKRGEHQEAEHLLRKVWKQRCKLLGPNHIDTLESASLLGYALRKQGKLDEVNEIYERHLETGLKSNFDRHNSQMYLAMWDLTRLFVLDDKYEKAEEIFQKWLDAGNGQCPDSTEGSRFAQILFENGKPDKAEVLYRKIVESKESKVGLKHHTTMHNIVYLGEALEKQQEYAKAEKELRRLLPGSEPLSDFDGREWDEACLCAVILVRVLSKQEKLQEAEEVARHLVSEQEKALGEDDLDTLGAYHDLADVLNQAKRYDEARVLYEKAYLGTEKKVGLEHPDTQEFQKDVERIRTIIEGLDASER